MNRIKSIKANAILNVFRQLCNTLLPLITLAYATRILQVESFGRIYFCSANVSYFVLIAGLGINTYAIREASAIRDNPLKIQTFVSQIFTINLLSTILAYVLLAIAVIVWNPTQEYIELIKIYSTSILLTTIGIDWYFQIYEDYLYITIRTIIVHIIQIILVFTLIKSPEDAILYAIIMVGTVGILQIINFIIVYKRVRFHLTPYINLGTHMKPILLLFANSILIVIYLNSDISMLGFMKGDMEVGIYKASVNVYQAVKVLLNAIYVVTIPRLSFYLAHGNECEYNKLANKILDTLFSLIIPALVGIICLSKNIILLISGESYIDSVWPLRILSGSLLFACIGGFFVNGILIVNKEEKIVIRATVISAFVNIALNVFLIPILGPLGAAITTMIAEMIVAIIAFIYAQKYVNTHLTTKSMLAAFVGCIGIIAICLACNALIQNYILSTCIAILGSVLFYFAIQMIIRPEFVKHFLRE